MLDLRARCTRLLHDVEVPLPFTLDSFCTRLSERRGRPIRLCAADLVSSGISGAWLGFDGLDVVVYEAATTPYHQLQIVFHEIGHLLCGHRASKLTMADEVGSLLPNLSPSTVASVLQRSSYSRREECEAEVLATLILERVMRESPRGGLSAGAQLDRLHEVLVSTFER